MSSERLQKILAAAGAGSRRAAERMIAEGRVRVNGRIVTELGTRADPRRDKIELDGRRIVAEQPAYYLLHKPREMVTTLADPEGRPSIADLVKHIPERVFPVGRLDYHTSGVLVLTNDGEMAQALLHPKKKVPKTYIAKFRGELPLRNLQMLREGVMLDGGEKTGKAELFVVNVEHGNTWLQITITEGKNRQIHRMGEAIGHRVMRLARVSFADLTTENLRPGEFRPITQQELARLKRDYLNPSQKAKVDEARTRRRAIAAGLADAGEADEGRDELEQPEAGAGQRAARARPERQRGAAASSERGRDRSRTGGSTRKPTRRPERERDTTARPERERSRAGARKTERDTSSPPERERSRRGAHKTERDATARPERQRNRAGSRKTERDTSARPERERRQTGSRKIERDTAARPERERNRTGSRKIERDTAARPERERNRTGSRKTERDTTARPERERNRTGSRKTERDTAARPERERNQTGSRKPARRPERDTARGGTRRPAPRAKKARKTS